MVKESLSRTNKKILDGLNRELVVVPRVKPTLIKRILNRPCMGVLILVLLVGLLIACFVYQAMSFNSAVKESEANGINQGIYAGIYLTAQRQTMNGTFVYLSQEGNLSEVNLRSLCEALIATK